MPLVHQMLFSINQNSDYYSCYIPLVEERLKCWQFQRNFATHCFDIKKPLGKLKECCIELKVSSFLSHIFGLVLSCGNFLNGGTNRGQADGFLPDILIKLVDTRGNDHQKTLFSYVIHILNKNKPDLIKSLPRDASYEDAARTSLSDLDQMRKRLKSNLEHCAEMAETVVSAGTDFGGVFQHTIPRFIYAAKLTMREIDETYHETEEYFKSLLLYFGYSETKAKTMPTNEFFAIFASFFREFEKQWEFEQRSKEKFLFDERVQSQAGEELSQAKSSKLKQRLKKPTLVQAQPAQSISPDSRAPRSVKQGGDSIRLSMMMAAELKTRMNQ